MTAIIIRSIVSLSLNKSSIFQKPISCYSISARFFSSSPTQKSKSPLSSTDHLIQRHNLSPEFAFKTGSLLPHVKDAEKCDGIISFLKESGFSNSHIEEALKNRPDLLFSSLEKTIKPKFKIFLDLGFSTNDVADIVAADPWILMRSGEDRIAPPITFLNRVLGSNADVVKLLKTSPWFLTYDLKKTMMPNIDYLMSCGVSSAQIVYYLFAFPRFFLQKPESIKQCVKRADDLGFDRKSNMFLAAIRMFGTMSEENWELKLKILRELGFSEDDIMSAFRRTPQAFAVSGRKMKEITEFLVSRKNIGIPFIISNPEVFKFSLEHRLKPRLTVFEILESKNLLRGKVSLINIIRMSDKMFREKFIRPYLNELDKVSVAIAGA